MTSPHAALAARLRAGTPTFAAWIGLTDPAVPELLARDGLDAVILDWQHGNHTQASIAAGISAAEAGGRATLVRLAVEGFADGARILDWGAAGVIAPMINSADDAVRLVNFTKFPPVGARSWGPMRAIAAFGGSPAAYLSGANASTVVLAMVETRAALAALDDILAVPGLDGVFAGPSDLSITLSDGAEVNAVRADVDAALDAIAAAARKHGKIAGAFATSGERAGQLARRGFHLLSISNDQTLLREATLGHLKRARALIEGAA